MNLAKVDNRKTFLEYPKSQHDLSYLEKLPALIIYKIFSFALQDYKELLNMAVVSKTIHRFITASSIKYDLYKPIYSLGEEKCKNCEGMILHLRVTCFKIVELACTLYPSIVSLSLKICKLTEKEAAIISKFQNLEELDLGSDAIGDNGAILIASSKLNLTSLSLNDNSIGNIGAEAIANGCPNLEILDLSNNAISAINIKKILINLQRLHALFLRNNAIGTTVKEFAPQLTRLKVLDLEENSIGYAEVQEIVKQQFKCLEMLRLGDNNIGDEGCQEIVKNLSVRLKGLALGGSKIGDEGAKAIAFQYGSSLKVIDLSCNPIGNTGMAALETAFQHLYKMGPIFWVGEW